MLTAARDDEPSFPEPREFVAEARDVGDEGDEVSRIRTSHQVFLPHDHPAAEPVIAKAEALLR